MNSNSETHIPLVVDLDGTLLKSDMLHECGMQFIRTKPLKTLTLLSWLRLGKAKFKERLADSVEIDVSVLPYDIEVINFISAEKKKNRKIILATATHHSLAQLIADHLGLFDHVFATTTDRNLSSHRKRDLMVETFGHKGYDYVGNSQDDVEVWEAAAKAYVVNPERGVVAKAKALGNVENITFSNKATLRDWLKGIRLHQWMKNSLIFVPLLAAHQVTDVSLLAQCLLAFVFFGLCASSVYILNDLLDLSDDRHHRTKKNRPFASGKISIAGGLLLFPTLLIIALGGSAFLLPPEFCATLLLYYGLTLTYSLWLKRHMTIDVIALASLYTLRIIAGAAALQLNLTFWLLAFSMFIFLSLALVKRYAELNDARAKGQTSKTRGRGYYPSDLEMVSSLGAASGYLSVMVLALYIHDNTTTTMYSHPQIIWLACPLLLFWITRMWMLTHRGQMNDDPVLFAARDKVSIITGALFGAVFWIAA
ncbi:UbiA family prenyltransferase [Pseudomonas sp. ADAK2]|uniref:UbiA family prenyltransferase n=1 Tax=unclassified Pseudomonas TaxID=196821 RepID=UPI00146365EE|nr:MULTISPECIES: UbiA family prenyltransferase [unclassified Pseudomonas]QJI44964.1 UbiA family prenyltransferase [Pseudomonas sp. ADAK7]QJI51265.1 UbiA family prenyltransferase [Pseudomonas sp. ADAK2]